MASKSEFLNSSKETDILVIGNGPAALILSYLLHGNTPYYNADGQYGRYPDKTLHQLLSNIIAQSDAYTANQASKQSTSLYDCVLHNLSLQSYILNAGMTIQKNVFSTINFLLDTLMAPDIDTDIEARKKTRIKWQMSKENAVNHIVIGSGFAAGGQWVGGDMPFRTLSYAEMLSLPGFLFSDYFKKQYGREPDQYYRPYRSEVAAYYAMYPSCVGIDDSIYTNYTVLSLRRSRPSHFTAVVQENSTGCLSVIRARNVVLATGVSTHHIPPDPILCPIISDQYKAGIGLLCDQQESRLNGNSNVTSNDSTVLIIGSGFSAADAIIALPPNKKIIHLFRWNPKSNPSPLRSCHRETYPEYATLYRLMKLAAAGKTVTPLDVKKSQNPLLRSLVGRYEGIPNYSIESIDSNTVRFFTSCGEITERNVDEFRSYIGRIGVISYLSSSLRVELGLRSDQIWASKDTFRKRILNRMMRWSKGSLIEGAENENEISISETYFSITESDLSSLISDENSVVVEDYSATYGLELSDNIFVIGSLVGDSLVRYTLGSCVVVAGNIIERFRGKTQS
ncbi:hypothetical protein V1511DRAFT_496816 [Dipodascopsis uninucleata]